MGREGLLYLIVMMCSISFAVFHYSQETEMSQVQSQVKMDLVKSTKGTHVYQNMGTSAPVKSLYVQREALPANPPKIINVQLTWAEE